MAQFDVYRVANELILDCQANLLAGLPTRITIPLEPVATAPRGIDKLNPIVRLNGEPFMLLTEYAGAVPRRALQDRVGSLEPERVTIQSALDLLLNGF